MKWTAESDARLRGFYSQGLANRTIAQMLRCTPSAVRNRIHNLQLKRNFYRRPYTPEEDALLRRLYADTPTKELVKRLNRSIVAIFSHAKKLGLAKSAAYMESPAACRLRRGDNVGAAFRFRPGHVPANKGLRRPGYSTGRMKETQFKKGQRSPNYLPVGTIRPNGDGYLRIKVSDAPEPPGARGAASPNWEFLHRRVWEAAHGPIPKGHRLWWKDGNHENCALENLELLSDKEHMARTTIHTLPPALKKTIMLAGNLKRRIRRIERDQKQTERSAESPVRNTRAPKGRREADGRGSRPRSLRSRAHHH